METKKKILITKGYKPTKAKSWNEHASTLAQYYAEQRELALKIDLEKNKLAQLSKGINTVGERYYFHEVTMKGRINYKAIPELRDMDLSKYVGPESTYWKLEEL